MEVADLDKNGTIDLGEFNEFVKKLNLEEDQST